MSEKWFWSGFCHFLKTPPVAGHDHHKYRSLRASSPPLLLRPSFDPPPLLRHGLRARPSVCVLRGGGREPGAHLVLPKPWRGAAAQELALAARAWGTLKKEEKLAVDTAMRRKKKQKVGGRT